MTNVSWQGLILPAIVLFTMGCSSIKKQALGQYFKTLKDKKLELISFSPPAPYKKQRHSVLDGLWWNSQSKSSISYFSSCSQVRRTLWEFQKSSFPENKQYKILTKKHFKNGLYSVLEMSYSPEKKTYTGVYTTRKDLCWLNINLVASSYSSFKKEEEVFKKFIRGFHEAK